MLYVAVAVVLFMLYCMMLCYVVSVSVVLCCVLVAYY